MTQKDTSKLDIDNQDIEPIESDSGLHSAEDPNGVEPDDQLNRRAAREALRHAGSGDAFIVKSDLEDDDQRDAAPGTREQP